MLEDATLYYEVFGEGEPLFLLHGFFLSSKHWQPFVEDFSNDFEVYLVDLTGHGRSSNFEDSVSITEAADDLYELTQYLGFEKIKAIGFSFGADVIFHLAANHPTVVESMIAIGGLGTWDVNNYPDWIEYFSYGNIENLSFLKEHHPEEERLKWLLDHFYQYTPFLSDEALANISANTLLVLGAEDTSIPLSEVSRARNLVPSFTFWVLPNTGHDAHQGKNKQEFVGMAVEFFKE